jgi:peptidoglycan/LPS O-acetylase OafA/YrhL
MSFREARNAINGSIWSLPYELACYLFLALFGLIGRLKNKWIYLMFFLCLMTINLLYPNEIRKIIIPIIGIDFKTIFGLFLFFFSATAFYVLREKIKYNLLLAVLLYVILRLLRGAPVFNHLALFVLPYLILSIAFLPKLKTNWMTRYGELSYGLYLYAFPVQQ